MQNSEVQLNSNKIRLRDWQEADLEPFAGWLRPGHLWKEFDGPYYPLSTEAQIEKMVGARRVHIKNGDWPTPRHSLVIAERATNQFIGCVTWDWESIETDWPVMGIVIYDSQFWGGGRGYEALGLWSAYLFRALPQIVRLDLRTWSGNVRMMGLARKLGYREEARFRKARKLGGKYYDGLGYGVLREEWEKLYPVGFTTPDNSKP